MNGERTPLVSATGNGFNNENNKTSVDYGSATGSTRSSSFSLRSLSLRVTDIIAHHTGSIGYLGSMSIAVNSLTGPAMLNLPALFSKAGIIPTICTLAAVCALSSFSCLHMANTISKVPNNANFKQQVEYSAAFSHFWGRWWFVATQVLFFGCITCLNISSIVDTAQVIDTFLGHWYPAGSAALVLITGSSSNVDDDAAAASQGRWVRWDYHACSEEVLAAGECLPFKDLEGVLLTAGNVLTTAIFLPLALMDLKENSVVQILGFGILILTSCQFIVQFGMSGLPNWPNASWWGHDWDDLFGVVMFNFCLVIVIPAWLYEREPHVDVPTVIHCSSIFSTVLYVTVGLLCHLAVPNVSSNMLESMMAGVFGTAMQLGASIFAFGIIGLGIPLFSVLVRLNLTKCGLCSRGTGNLLAVYLPFCVSWLLYGGDYVAKLLSWGGIIFTSLVAFILPILLALHTVKEFDEVVGSISVYFGHFESKAAEITSLQVLLCISIVAVGFAILGNII